MKHTSKAAEKSTVKITLKFDAAEWKEAQQKAYLKLRGRFAVNGFRKAKHPRTLSKTHTVKVFSGTKRSTPFSLKTIPKFSKKTKTNTRLSATPKQALKSLTTKA